MQGIGKEAKWKLMGRDSDETGFYAQPDSDKFDRATLEKVLPTDGQRQWLLAPKGEGGLHFTAHFETKANYSQRKDLPNLSSWQ